MAGQQRAKAQLACDGGNANLKSSSFNWLPSRVVAGQDSGVSLLPAAIEARTVDWLFQHSRQANAAHRQ